MARHFPSWRSYWDFLSSVRSHRRFVHAPEVDAFLDLVLATGRKRAVTLPKGLLLWRSQLGTTFESRVQTFEGGSFETEEEEAFPPERMVPLPDAAVEGRVNPKGIPCIYLSDDQDTALAEVRPWIGAAISVGQFELLGDTRVVDFSRDDGRRPIFLKEPTPAKRTKVVWRDINRAFSRPVTPSEQHADYVGTQIIAELFKANGYDGVVFKSSCGTGRNVALFEISRVRLLGAAPFEAKTIRFTFRQTNNPYVLKRERRS